MKVLFHHERLYEYGVIERPCSPESRRLVIQMAVHRPGIPAVMEARMRSASGAVAWTGDPMSYV